MTNITDPFQATASFMRLSGYLFETQMRTGMALMGVALRAGGAPSTERAKSCKRPVPTASAQATPRGTRPRPVPEMPKPSATLVEMTG